ncbi:hypothetical protein [Aurantiacibacter zhengii]|uniref:Lipoprotein n=1 Tax=Aurantiacibacter zhengii TaxID=2307003 RepID=A0A418NUJ5_9SPHN|nr:hypothetical protein [Aurantiacibacter zhengii]RIV87713.1 hypothetical protein D2V07_05075 [Aurantiacibacter zhengii]
MSMRAKLALPVALLTLAACGSQDEPSEPRPDAAETAIPVEPNGGIGDGAPSLTQTDDLAQDDGIPARYHGAWDYVDGNCNPASDLRVEISADQVIFYESVGEVENVSIGADGADVALAMEGEGENWNSRFRLSLQGNPERLVMQNVDYPSDPTNIRKRCAS